MIPKSTVSVMEVETFILENQIDENAARNLRQEQPHIQRIVLDRGSLQDCSNPSSAVIGRIRDAKAQAPAAAAAPFAAPFACFAGMQFAGSAPGLAVGVAADEIERFISDNRIDDSAAMQLRVEPPHVQRSVLDRGSLAECTNPSSAVIGRIRDAKLQAKYGGNDVARFAGGGAMRGVAAVPMPMSFPGACASTFSFTGGTATMPGMAYIPSEGMHAPAVAHRGFIVGEAAEVEAFILANRLDPTAAQHLRSEPAHIQRAVIDRGSLAECVNPSSAVIGRIRDAKMDVLKNGKKEVKFAPVAAAAPGGAISSFAMAVPEGRLATSEELDAFIADNRLDDGAARNLRAESAAVQTAVINRGSLADCLNPSSAVIGRIRDAKLLVKYPASGGAGLGQTREALSRRDDGGAVDLFILDNNLDDGAARALRDAAPDVQDEVINRGSLLACTNPSSAVMGRIREAKLSKGSSSGYGAVAATQSALLRVSPYSY